MSLEKGNYREGSAVEELDFEMEGRVYWGMKLEKVLNGVRGAQEKLNQDRAKMGKPVEQKELLGFLQAVLLKPERMAEVFLVMEKRLAKQKYADLDGVDARLRARESLSEPGNLWKVLEGVHRRDEVEKVVEGGEGVSEEKKVFGLLRGLERLQFGCGGNLKKALREGVELRDDFWGELMGLVEGLNVKSLRELEGRMRDFRDPEFEKNKMRYLGILRGLGTSALQKRLAEWREEAQVFYTGVGGGEQHGEKLLAEEKRTEEKRPNVRVGGIGAEEAVGMISGALGEEGFERQTVRLGGYLRALDMVEKGVVGWTVNLNGRLKNDVRNVREEKRGWNVEHPGGYRDEWRQVEDAVGKTLVELRVNFEEDRQAGKVLVEWKVMEKQVQEIWDLVERMKWALDTREPVKMKEMVVSERFRF